jgi:hypothetical protein
MNVFCHLIFTVWKVAVFELENDSRLLNLLKP